MWRAVPIIIALWIAWPYYAAYSLFIAFRDGDASVLEDRVAWDSVRQGLRGDLNVLFLGTLTADSKKDDTSAIGSGLAMLFGPAIINQVIDNYLTPQAIAAANRADVSTSSNDGALANIDKTVQNARRELQLDQVRYAFFSGGPFTFRIDILPEGDPPPEKPIKLIFKFSGDWKLTRVDFLDAVQEQQRQKVLAKADLEAKLKQADDAKRDQRRKVAARLSQSEIDALRARLMALWSPPVGVQDPNELIVNVTIKLRPDGRLAAPPFARPNGRSVAAMASRDSAVRAVLTGQPFDMLKPEHYESWKEIELTFDPKDMFRSN